MVQMWTWCVVPLFYVLSGYLFFFSIDRTPQHSYTDVFIHFIRTDYPYKLTSRIKTLLIPYLLWNVIFIFYNWLNSGVSPFVNTTVGHFIAQNFWGVPPRRWGISPADFPLYYIRDLIVLTIVSPIIFYLIKRFRVYWVLITCLIWLFGTRYWINYPYHITKAVCFFSWGAYFSILNKDIIRTCLRYRLLAIIYPFFLTCTACKMNVVTRLGGFETFIGMIATTTLAISIVCSTRCGKRSWLQFCSNGVFMVFAVHIIVLNYVRLFITKHILPTIVTPTQIMLYYLLVPICVVIICWGLYYLLHRFYPKCCAILTGGR